MNRPDIPFDLVPGCAPNLTTSGSRESQELYRQFGNHIGFRIPDFLQPAGYFRIWDRAEVLAQAGCFGKYRAYGLSRWIGATVSVGHRPFHHCVDILLNLLGRLTLAFHPWIEPAPYTTGIYKCLLSRFG